MPNLSDTAPRFFRKDLERLNTVLEQAGAVLPQDPSDGFQGLDPTILPEVQDTYQNLTSYGWANGWLLP